MLEHSAVARKYPHVVEDAAALELLATVIAEVATAPARHMRAAFVALHWEAALRTLCRMEALPCPRLHLGQLGLLASSTVLAGM